ncbi:hypothetical protein [Antribacter gilvus]|uniref:hypothetical protein n=1 Tax=Antribacter gilvus TaxID=2304675 RepID=UPI000F76DF87|nr:hypothetical protein [Antribacter gilvus]
MTVGLLAASALAAVPAAASGAASGTGLAAASVAAHGGGSPSAVCSRTDALFCEDFESLPVGGAASLDWGIDTRHGTLQVERAGRAGKVLHVHTEGNGMAFLKVVDFSAPGNSFYGRLRLKVDDFPTAPDWAHFTLVEATGSGSPEVVRPLGGQFAPTVGPDATFWGVGADGGPTGDWTNWRESAPTVEDRWQCVEFQWSGPENRVSVWFDGVEQPDLEVSTTNHGGADTDFVLPTADTIKVGWQLYQGGPTPDHFDVLMDDIAFDTDRLGCAR